MNSNRPLRLALGFAFLSLLCLAGARGQNPTTPKAVVLERQIRELAASFPGKVGVYVKNVETGATASVNPDELFPMASTYKVPIMLQVFRDAEAGKLSLTERVTLTRESERPGSGLLHAFTPGLAPTIHDLMLMMITVSDNEATDILLDRVSAANVTATLQKLGIPNIRVDRTTEQIIGDWLAAADPKYRGKNAAEILAHPEAETALTQEQMDKAAETLTADPKDHSSPRAMGDLLEKIIKNEAASEKSCTDLLGIMQKQEHRQRISRYMGEGLTATKSGTIGATTNDVGILWVGNQHVIVSVYTVKASSEVATGQAEELIGRIARASYDYFDIVGSAH